MFALALGSTVAAGLAGAAKWYWSGDEATNPLVLEKVQMLRITIEQRLRDEILKEVLELFKTVLQANDLFDKFVMSNDRVLEFSESGSSKHHFVIVLHPDLLASSGKDFKMDGVFCDKDSKLVLRLACIESGVYLYKSEKQEEPIEWISKTFPDNKDVKRKMWTARVPDFESGNMRTSTLARDEFWWFFQTK